MSCPNHYYFVYVSHTCLPPTLGPELVLASLSCVRMPGVAFALLFFEESREMLKRCVAVVVRCGGVSRRGRPEGMGVATRGSAPSSRGVQVPSLLVQYLLRIVFCCFSHCHSRSQVRGHRTGPSHQGMGKYPRKKIKPSVYIACISSLEYGLCFSRVLRKVVKFHIAVVWYFRANFSHNDMHTTSPVDRLISAYTEAFLPQ